MKKAIITFFISVILAAGLQSQNMYIHKTDGSMIAVDIYDIDSITFSSWNCGLPVIYEGHEYSTVQIGEHCWFAENLKYLPSVSPPTDGSETEPRYYVYDYSGTSVSEAKATDNYQNYGVLYNYPAASISCPDGWHSAEHSEWLALFQHVNNNSGPLKSTRTAPDDPHPRWNSPNTGATNSTGFTGFPGGARSNNNTFTALGLYGIWYSSEISATEARRVSFDYDNTTIFPNYYQTKSQGNAVRCVRNEN